MTKENRKVKSKLLTRLLFLNHVIKGAMGIRLEHLTKAIQKTTHKIELINK